MSLDADLDALHAAPPGEFVERRKQLATALRKAGDKESATRVAALPKPTPAAWAVNALWTGRRKDVEALLDLGERLRDALRASFSGRADGRAAATLQQEQRETIDHLVRAAREQLEKAGATSSQAVLEKVASTLRAISTTGSWDDATPGRLARELETPDLATLAGLLMADGASRGTSHGRPRASAAPPRAAAASKSESRVRAPAPEARRDTAEDTRRAQRIAKAEAQVERAGEREQAAQDASARAAAVAARTREEAEAAAAEVAEAQRAAEEAEAAVVAARKAADGARAAVAAVEKKLATADRRRAEAEERAARAASDAAEAREARAAAREALAEARKAR